MVSEQNNQQLLARCRRGDAKAWHLLVKRYGRLVHSIPVRYGLTPSEVDDVGQEVFLALAQGIAKIEDPESLPAWLITTARRHSWRALQKRKREQPLSGVDLAEADMQATQRQAGDVDERAVMPLGGRVPSMTELVHGWQQQEALAQGLGKLKERCRQLLTAIFLDEEEPSYDEISERMGIAKGSIGPTRNRCLQQLRSILEGLGFAGDDL